MEDLTRLLHAVDRGDPQAAKDLLPLVYDELRKLAAQKMAREKPGQTLQATALIHDAYLRLTSRQDGASEETQWKGRGHFFAAAAEAMRRILVEAALRKKRTKHGGGVKRLPIDPNQPKEAPNPASQVEWNEDLLRLNQCLGELERDDPVSAQVVKLHFFAGLSLEEVAENLQVSRATAYRYWSYARAWLRCSMENEKIGFP